MIPSPSIFEPITLDNLHELQPGEWIWDNQMIRRDEHKRTLWHNIVEEPIGFRQIHILDIDGIPHLKPFMLSTIDNYGHGHVWENLSENRFYKFRKDLK